MDITTTIALASVFGALVFLAAGYILAGQLRRDDGLADTFSANEAALRNQLREGEARAQVALDAQKALEQEIAQAKREREAAEQELAEERERATMLANDLEHSRDATTPGTDTQLLAENAELLMKVQKLEKAEAQAAATVKAAEAKVTAAKAAEAKATAAAKAAEAKAAATRATPAPSADSKRVAELEEELATVRTTIVEGQKTAEVDAQTVMLEQEVERLRASLTQAQKSAGAAESARMAELENELEHLRKTTVPAEELEKVRSKQRHVLVQSRMLQQKAEEMENHARENAALRQQLSESEYAAKELEQLQLKMKKAEAALFAANIKVDLHSDPSKKPAKQAPRTTMIQGSGSATREQLAENEMLKLLSEDGTRAVVVADEQGLMLAAAGEEGPQEPLAVFAGAITGIRDLSRDMFPLDDVTGIHIVDKNGVSIAGQLFTDAGEPMVLARIGRNQRANDMRVLGCVRNVSQILR